MSLQLISRLLEAATATRLLLFLCRYVPFFIARSGKNGYGGHLHTNWSISRASVGVVEGVDGEDGGVMLAYDCLYTDCCTNNYQLPN